MTDSIFIRNSLNFTRQQKLTTDSGNKLNTVMFYDDVYVDSVDPTIRVDALITFYDAKNAFISEFDSLNVQYKNPEYFQPIIYISGDDIGSPDSKESYASFNIQFIKNESLTKTVLDNLYVSLDNNQLVYNGLKFYDEVTLKGLRWDSYDIDGLSINGKPSESRQFVQTTQFNPNQIVTYPSPIGSGNPGQTSALDVLYPGPGMLRVQSAYGGNATDPIGSLQFNQHRVSVGMQDTSYFNVSFGDIYNQFSYVGAFALNFSPDPIVTNGFYVADKYKGVFVYNDTGALTSNWSLGSKKKSARDITSNKEGTNLWVIDKYKNVNKYDITGAYLGSWKTDSDSKPEGIAYDNYNSTNAIWTANEKGNLGWYSGGGGHTFGAFVANQTFKLNLGSKNKLKGIVSDDSNLWVVIDGDDQIRKYSIQRNGNTPLALNLVGTWDLPDAGKPTGITLNQNQTQNGDIWVVDYKTDNITNYRGLRGATSGSVLSPVVEVNLVSGNEKPQGLTNPGTIPTQMVSVFDTDPNDLLMYTNQSV